MTGGKRLKHSGVSDLKIGFSFKPTLGDGEAGWAAAEYQWKNDALRFADKSMGDGDRVAEIQDDPRG